MHSEFGKGNLTATDINMCNTPKTTGCHNYVQRCEPRLDNYQSTIFDIADLDCARPSISLYALPMRHFSRERYTHSVGASPEETKRCQPLSLSSRGITPGLGRRPELGRDSSKP